jgi:hypothetical protein
VRRIAPLIASLLLIAGLVLAEQWIGWVTDQKCASAGNYEGSMHKQCVKAGEAVVFVNDADKKMYKLKDPQKVERFVGQKVTLDGTIQGDTIDVKEARAVTSASR